MREINIDLWPKQAEALKVISNKTCEVLGYGGARGGGKSHLIRAYLISRALKYPNSRHLLIRKTFPELQRNHIDELLKDFVSVGVCRYVERRHQLVFDTNGSIIELSYCESPRDLIRFQGGEYDTICLDEAQFHVKKVFQDLRACLRTTDENLNPKFLMTFNPGGIGHSWLKRLFIDRLFEAGENPEHFHFVKALVHDNPSIIKNDPDYIKRLEALPEPQRSAMLNGDFSVFEGQFFQVSPLSLVKPFQIEESESMECLYGSLDHGISHPTSFGLWYMNKQTGYLYRLFSYLNNGGTTATHAEEIYQRIASFPWTNGQMPVTIWADPSMWTKQRLNEDMFRSNIDEYIDLFSSHGARTIFEKANNDKINGCAIMRQHLAETDGVPKVYFFEGYNTTFLDNVTAVETDPNNRDIYLKMDGDDVADETRYGIVGLYSTQASIKRTSHFRNKVDNINQQRERLDWYSL